MGFMADWTSLRQRSAGKWQIPLFLLSTVLLGSAVLHYRRAARELSPADALVQLALLESRQSHVEALDLAQTTLLREGLKDADRAQLHLHLARSSAALAVERRITSEAVGDGIVQAYGEASAHELPFMPDDFANLGRAHEWRGRFVEAIKYYERAIELGLSEPDEVRRHILLMRKQKMDASPAEYGAAVDKFLATLDPARLDMRLWAVEQKLETQSRLNAWEEANGLLVRERPQFQDSAQAEGFQYLECLVLFKTGRFDEAERLLRAVRNRVSVTDEVHARTGWLLGRTILHDGGPQRPVEAVSFFNDVIEHHAESPYAVASRIGLAEAYAYLNRHDDAVSTYRIALEDIDQAKQADLADEDVLRASLGIMAEAMRVQGDLKAALDYAELMGTLIDRRQTEQATVQLRQLMDCQ